MGEKKIEELKTVLKTYNLISALAQDADMWTEKDVERAIRETNSAEFTLDDVQYVRDCNDDEYIQDAQKTIDYLFRELARRQKEERKEFYDTQIKPHIEARDRYKKAFIKSRFSNLKYYAK